MLLEVGAALTDVLKVAISSSPLPALDDVLAGDGAWLWLGLACGTVSCRLSKKRSQYHEASRQQRLLSQGAAASCHVYLCQSPEASAHSSSTQAQ